MGMAAIRSGSESDADTRNRLVYEGSLLLTLLLNLFLILAIGWRYDVRSVFQGRSLSFHHILLSYSRLAPAWNGPNPRAC